MVMTYGRTPQAKLRVWPIWSPAGSITPVWGLSIQGLKGATPVTRGQGDPPLQTRGPGGASARCAGRGEPEQPVRGQLCALPATVPPSRPARAGCRLSMEAPFLEISGPRRSGVRGPGKRVRVLVGAEAVGARAPGGGPGMRCSPSPRLTVQV